MSDELKERNILKLILIARFACVTLDVGHSIDGERGTKIPHHILMAEELGLRQEPSKARDHT
jgi:hypothetical protein